MKTTTTWISEMHFKSQQEHHIIDLDGKRKNGFSPKALLLAGLGACTGIDVVEILQKMRIDFSGLKIETEAEQTEKDPKVFKDISITFTMKSDPSNEEKIRKAIDLSLEKYCGVAAMLRKNSGIHYNLILE